MYGRVVNKHARYNLCYAENSQEPSYAEGKGRIIPFDAIPLTKHIRNSLENYFGIKGMLLVTKMLIFLYNFL